MSKQTSTSDKQLSINAVDSMIGDLPKYLTQWKDSTLNIGSIVVAVLDHGSSTQKDKTRALITSAFGTPVAFQSFESVGRKALLPELFMEHNFERAKRLTLSDQRSLYFEGVAVVEATKGGWDTRILRFSEMTAKQLSQVIDKDRVRTVDEQKKWLSAQVKQVLKEQETKAKAEFVAAKQVASLPAIKPDWEIVNGEIVFYRPCRVSKAELLNIFNKVMI